MFTCLYAYVYVYLLYKLKNSNTMRRTFYIKPDQIETMYKFQDKCRQNGHRSYSEVLIELMENYIENGSESHKK